MVQVIPQAPSIGDLLGQALGEGIAGVGKGASGGLQAAVKELLEQKKLTRGREEIQSNLKALPENATIQDKINTVLSSRATPQTQKQIIDSLKVKGAQEFAQKFKDGQIPSISEVLEGMALGYIPPGVGQEFARAALEDPALKQFRQHLTSELLGQQQPEGIEEEEIDITPATESVAEEEELIPPSGTIENAEETIAAPEREEFVEEGEIAPIRSISEPLPQKVPRVTKTGKGWAKYNDDDLTLMKAGGGDLGKAAGAELSRREKEARLAFDKLKIKEDRKKFGHQQTAKYAENLNDLYDNARETLQAVNEVKRVSQEGHTGVNARNLLISFLKNRESFLTNAFLTKDLQSLISATKTLAGGFRALFGGRPTQREFFWYENILPDILKNMDTNVAAADYFGKIAEFNIKKQEIADEITENNGGYRPLDLDAKVRNRLKPELNKLIKEGEELQKSLKTREPEKKNAANIIKKVPAGTKLTDETVDALLEYTNQDAKRARKIAEQLGYEI